MCCWIVVGVVVVGLHYNARIAGPCETRICVLCAFDVVRVDMPQYTSLRQSKEREREKQKNMLIQSRRRVFIYFLSWNFGELCRIDEIPMVH